MIDDIEKVEPAALAAILTDPSCHTGLLQAHRYGFGNASDFANSDRFRERLCHVAP